MEDYQLYLDFVLFNVCWLLNAYGTSTGNITLGPSLILLAIVIHLSISNNLYTEMVFIVTIGIIGFGLDSLAQFGGIMNFSGQRIPGMAPVWMFFQWLVFAILFENTLDWLKDYLLVAVVCAFVGGPLSYYSASSFGILSINEPLTLNLLVYGFVWSLFFPLALLLHEKYNRFCSQSGVKS